MKLLLFDIDGTILHTHGIGRRSVETTLSALTGRPIRTKAISFSGKTDPQILVEVLLHHGIEPEEPLLADALEAYTEAMHEALATSEVTLLSGVADLLDHLQAVPGIQLGLVTGNLEPLAYRKLNAVGLDHHFSFGAFGSDHADRPELPPIAIRRAFDRTGHRFDGPDVIIIGDTEHDIACCRSVGALAVAVATGHFSRDHLARFAPDVLLDDLADIEAFTREVLERAAS